MNVPTWWIGPAGSGKIGAIRNLLGTTLREPRLKTLVIDDYTSRYWDYGTHSEIDVMDLSMMDKQILPEMLQQLVSTRDVRTGGRKQLIVRRIHCLSPAAALRFRALLEDLVMDPQGSAMIGCTARTVNSVVGTVLDCFAVRRHAAALTPTSSDLFFNSHPSPATFLTDVMREMADATKHHDLTLDAVAWIRERTYNLMGMLCGGSDIVAGLVWATVQLAATGALDGDRARRVLRVLADTRWVPTYRTPIMIECVLSHVYVGLRT